MDQDYRTPPQGLLLFALLFTAYHSMAPSSAPSAKTSSGPLVELLFSNDLKNTGSLDGAARVETCAPGEAARFGLGVRGMGLDLTASSRGGGSDRTKAGARVLLDAPALEKLDRMTLTAWFNPVGINAPARLLYYAPSWDLFVAYHTIGFKTRSRGKDQPHQTPRAKQLVAPERWNFVAVTFDARAGVARCYHGLRGGSLELACEWKGIPPLDRGPAVLEIGNLGGIRPFRGRIDSVRIFGRVLSADELRRVYAADSRPRLSLAARAGLLPRPRPLFKHSDVCFSSRSIHRNSIAMFKAFHATRLMWAYSTRPDFIRRCKEAGAATYQAAINSLPGHDNTAAHCLDLDGKPVVAPWMVAFNRRKPVYWGCNNRPAFMKTSLERARRALQSGADWIQFDDWPLIVSAGGWGGACFCDDCMAGFRAYLQKRLSSEERVRLKLGDLAAFDYRRYLAAHDHVRTAADYKARRRSLPLREYFEDFQRRSVRRFFIELRRRLNAAAGRVVPLSVNSTFLRPEERFNFLVDIADFLEGEMWYLDLESLTIACKAAEGLGKPQVFVPKPKNAQTMRMAIAAAYAMGQFMLVPWDMYMGSDAKGVRPRYYGTPEQYGDLYRFIRRRAALFDGFENPAGVGVVVNLDHFDHGRVAMLCRRLLDAQTPFMFLPVGRAYYELRLAPERLRKLDLVLLAAKEAELPKADRDALKAAAKDVAVLVDRDASTDLLRDYAPVETWAPRGVYVLPRIRPDAKARTLVCHVLNRVDATGAAKLKWISFVVKRWAFPGRRLRRVRWHVPGREPTDLEFERLSNGARVIVPQLDIWGMAELRFE